jgi:hypothetical protein
LKTWNYIAQLIELDYEKIDYLEENDYKGADED